MDVEAGARVDAGNDAIEGERGGSADVEFHRVSLADAVESGFVGIHVDVNGGADDALFEFEGAGGTHQKCAGCAGDVAGDADGEVEAEADRVGEREFDLRLFAQRAEDAEVRYQAAARPDDGDGLFGGEEAFLKERAMHGELVAGAVEDVEIGAADVEMAGR